MTKIQSLKLILLFILVVIFSARSNDVYWNLHVRLHDGQVIKVKHEANAAWHARIGQFFSGTKNPVYGHYYEASYVFPLPQGEVRWSSADAGFGKDAEAFPSLFDVIDGIPYVVVPVLNDKNGLCNRLGMPANGVVVFAYRNGKWKRVADTAVPLDYRLNLNPTTLEAADSVGAFQGEVTEFQMLSMDMDGNEMKPPRRLTLEEHFKVLRNSNSCAQMALIYSANRAVENEKIANAKPLTTPIEALLEEVVEIGEPGQTYTQEEFKTKFPQYVLQNDCNPAIEHSSAGYLVNRTSGKSVVLKFPEVKPLMFTGVACHSDTLHFLFLPPAVDNETHFGRLYTVGRDGSFQSLRLVRLPEIAKLRRFGKRLQELHPSLLRFEVQDKDLVLHLAEQRIDKSDWYVPVKQVHVYRIPL